MISKGRIALGILSVIGVVGGVALDYKEGEEEKQKQRQEAYKAGCDVAREYYEKKGNPNQKRKKGGKSQ